MKWAFDEDGKKQMYPINDKNHLANAIAIICKNGTPLWFTPAQRRKVYHNIINQAKEFGIILTEDTLEIFKRKCLLAPKPIKQTFVFR